ncbi:MAG: MMPL family transporter [Bradymonadaceae bacterium]|nr:MMPL family transporter [Lujinxingiaceae bacterium]
MLRGLEVLHSHRRITAALVVALSFASLLLAARLEFVTSYVDMIPESTPQVQAARLGLGEIESTQELIVAISGPAEGREQFARHIYPAIAGLDAVASLDFEYPVAFFEHRWLLMLEPAEQERVADELVKALGVERRRHNPFFVALKADQAHLSKLEGELRARFAPSQERLAITADGQYLLLSVQPRVTLDTAISDYRPIVDQIRHAIESVERPKGVDYRLSGQMLVALEEYDGLTRDLGRASALSFALILLILIVATRRPALVLSCALSLLVGTLLTLAATQLVLGRLNVVSAFMLPALMGLGIDFGIHLHNAYDDFLRQHRPHEAMQAAVRKLFPGCLAAASTTAAAFVALLVSDFAGIEEYGVIASIGIFLMLLSTFVVSPLLSPLIWRKASRAPLSRPSVRLRPGIVTVVVMAVLLAAMAGLGSTGFSNDFKHLRGDLEATAFHEYLMDDAGHPFEPTLLLVDSTRGAALVAEIARAQQLESATGHSTEISRVVAMSDFLPASDPDSEAMQRLRAELERLPADHAQLIELRLAAHARGWERDELPESIRRRLSLRAGGEIVAVFSRAELGSDTEFAIWQNDMGRIQQQALEQGVEARLVDKWAVVHRMIELIRESFWPMLLTALALVALTCLVFLRSPREAALALGTVVLGTLAFGGALGWLGLPLNIFSIVVLPSILGIGIDNAIQLTEGFRHDDFWDVLRTRAVACATSTATTAAGFGAMLIANHRGIASLGQTALVGLGLMFLATTVLVPALVVLMRTHKERRP